MLEILAMLLLVVLALFAVGSGLCAILGLIQLATGGGAYFALVGGALAGVSLAASIALYRLVSRPPRGSRDDGQG